MVGLVTAIILVPLIGALAAYATAIHTHSATLGFAAGIATGAVLAAGFGGLVIWLSTNQYATGLALSLFGMGYSWGGYESLVVPFDSASYRTATAWSPGGPSRRLHIGLENVEDLKADLERGLAALA